MVIDGFLIFVIVATILVVGLVLLSARVVPQGFEYTVERFGRWRGTLQPGLHFIVPVVDTIGRNISVMETVLNIPSQSVITRDNAEVEVDAVVFYRVVDSAKAAYQVDKLEAAIENLAMTNIRTVLGSLEMDQALSEREAMNRKLLSVIDEATSTWGVQVRRVEIRDISPPQNLVAAMSRQMEAERHRRAEVTLAEGKKAAAILEAEGRREAAFRDAEARERSAEAEAKSTQLVSDAIQAGDAQALQYFVGQQYVEALKAFAGSPNQKVLLMPLETTGVLGSLAGVAELLRDSLTADESGAPRRRGRSALPTSGDPSGQA
ncbi:SPFH domain-containing protein [Algihabitans albus]|uniref:SPFH domain-containing protein n=1 Tax=Algihabitans albus TaxID=2164067 RepID=UPI001ABBF13F|nr:SPFH domain-containing protein [Algihabitans albus]